MQLIFALLSGLLISAGIAISKMIDPNKVISFLDVSGNWDPSLALVMAAALVVYAVGYRLVIKRPAPLFSNSFNLPDNKKLDKPLLLGAAIFGVGWGLVGYCPGPAIAALPAASSGTAGFVATMILGWFIAAKLMALRSAPTA